MIELLEKLPDSTRQFVLLWAPGALQLVGKLCYAVLIFLVGRWLSMHLQKVTRALLVRSRVDPALVDFLSSLVRYAVLAASIIAALEKLDVKTASLLAVFASAGLAVGLALQGSLSNFAAGTMILFFRPFGKGDRIEVAGKQGLVDEIGIFTTRLVSSENETIIIPNSSVTGGTIINFTMRGDRRATVSVDLKEDDDLDALTALVEKAALENRYRDPDVSPRVLLTDQNKLSVRIAIPAADYEAALDLLRRRIFEDLRTLRRGLAAATSP
ncbi:mechanosensitive ion channel [bacterium]|nr:mechanosensitive ion channel [bacterium]